jgi:hypothetical protein
MALYMTAEKFLAKHLGGRYQDGGTTEAVARLKEITVDPKTVMLAKKMDANAVGLPKTAVDLQPGEYKYKATISAGGQQISATTSTTITEDKGMWTATGTMESPMGKGSDVCTMEKGTLVLHSRTIKQGMATVNVDFAGNKATGNLSMNGQDRPISANIGGPVFADAAGSELVIASLPLADGYSTTFRNFDVQKQKEALWQLKVTGVESVTVPAGTFDAYKVDLTSADGGTDKKTLWIAKDSRKPVKMSAVLGSMGGAILTQELVP